MRIIRLLLLVATPAGSAAQGPGDTVTVVAGPGYRAGALHRWLFGTGYRDLWTTPIRVPVLDLRRFAGGLTATEKGGRRQTVSLRFAGVDGKEYVFRSVDKDPRPALPEELRETFIAALMQDKISSQHPTGSLAVAPLLDAVGVLHVTPELYWMPDDPALGEFRAEFAGMLGLLEERPNTPDSTSPAQGPGQGRPLARPRGDQARLEEATAIESSDDLYERLGVEPPYRVDEHALLTARLMDVFVGDWDRHPNNYRWARLDGQWKAVPVDRDMAFSRFDGLLMPPGRWALAELTDFGPEYPRLRYAIKVGMERDRLLLAGVSRSEWDSVAAWLHSRLTDSVIAEAVARLPKEYQAMDGARMREALRSRRAGLPAIASRFYSHLASHVDVLATDSADDVAVERHQDGSTTVRLATGGTEYFRRRFVREETREVRIYLGAGDDRVAVEGEGEVRWPRVRIIRGDGTDEIRIRPGARGGIHQHAPRTGEDRISYARRPPDWGRFPYYY